MVCKFYLNKAFFFFLKEKQPASGIQGFYILLGETDIKQTQKRIYNKTCDECFGVKECYFLSEMNREDH